MFSAMKIVVIVARLLLGLIFVVFGLNGFLLFFPPPPGLPPLVTEFDHAVTTSHFTWLPSGVQVVGGLMFLANRYTTLATILLGAVIVNILMFHVTMFMVGILPGLITTVLWFVVAWSLRAQLAPLFVNKVKAK